MLSNILKSILQKRRVNNDNIQKTIDLFSKYRIGTYIYPSVVKRETKLDIEEIYYLLTELEKHNFLKSYYEVVCTTCNHSYELYEVMNQIPKEIVCENCENRIEPIETAKIVFKVINK